MVFKTTDSCNCSNEILLKGTTSYTMFSNLFPCYCLLPQMFIEHLLYIGPGDKILNKTDSSTNLHGGYCVEVNS